MCLFYQSIFQWKLSSLNTRESLTNPGNRSDTYSYDIGEERKIGFGPNIMLDATINFVWSHGRWENDILNQMTERGY